MDLALKEKVVKAVLKTIDQGWYHKDIDLSAILIQQKLNIND